MERQGAQLGGCHSQPEEMATWEPVLNLSFHAIPSTPGFTYSLLGFVGSIPLCHSLPQKLTVALTNYGIKPKLASIVFMVLLFQFQTRPPSHSSGLEHSVPHLQLPLLPTFTQAASSTQNASFPPAGNLMCSSVPNVILIPPFSLFISSTWHPCFPLGVFGLALESLVRLVL